MTNLIRLRPHHKKTRSLKTSGGFKSYTEEQLLALLEEGDIEGLVLALRWWVSYIVSRFIGNWTDSRPFEEDMVGVGFLAISRLSQKISLDFLAGRDILKVASQYICDDIENYLNDFVSVTSPSVRTQISLIAKGDDPIYYGKADIQDTPDSEHPVDTGDEWKRDILDALECIEPTDEIDAALLNRFNWGRGYQELADELGVGVGTIHRRKARLFEKFQELMR